MSAISGAFQHRLDSISERNESLLCIGLDPVPALMPIRDVFTFNREIVDATYDLVCAYKPNLAFYEAMGIPGLKALENTIQHIRIVAPNVLILGDGKRGDVGNTSEAYAKALFEVWGFDGATVNVYGGRDATQPFLDYGDRGVFIWCRSSNIGAGEFQGIPFGFSEKDKSRPLYEQVAIRAAAWNEAKNIGLVVGATYPAELQKIRKLCPEMPFLIPGIGSQEGSLVQAVCAGTNDSGRRAIISVSRSVLYASQTVGFADSARAESIRLRSAISRILNEEGWGW